MPMVVDGLAVLEEAARRASWDALHGPRHLRTGRFFISGVLLTAHAWTEPDEPLPCPEDGVNPPERRACGR